MMTRVWLMVLVSAGCTVRPWTEESASGSSSGGSSTTTAGASTGAPTSGASGSQVTGVTETTGEESGTTSSGTTGEVSSSSSSVGFIPVPDVPGGEPQCDGWMQPEQDCPEGQKCTYNGEFSLSHCVDVVDEPKQEGEPCQILEGGWISGIDDCAAGSICWEVDPDTGFGTCVAFCLGPIEELHCANGAGCTVCQECALGLCLPQCDPIAQDCASDDLCIPNPNDPNAFLCVLDASGEEGQVFDACEYANACDKGLVCLGPELAVECDPQVIGCCALFCDTSAVNTCPGAGQECLAWYEEGTAPPGFENVGVCGVPP